MMYLLRHLPRYSKKSYYTWNCAKFCTLRSHEGNTNTRVNTLEDFEKHMKRSPNERPLYSNRVTNEITCTLTQFKSMYGKTLNNGEKMPETMHTVVGRIYAKRDASKKLIFYDIISGTDADNPLKFDHNNTKIQVMSPLQNYHDPDEFAFIHGNLTRGDIVAIRGYPAKTKLGELSIVPHRITLLAPCTHNLPLERVGLKDPIIRFGQRYLDLLINRDIQNVLITRAKIIARLRHFLDSRGFLEVETPILSSLAGGASATPFKTHSHAIGKELFLRISPELYLKQLVIGGLERVYEIGKLFRNEGVDHSHNPEFTSCEFYQAYANYLQLMDLTEELLRDIVRHVNGSLKVTVETDEGSQIVIDFEPPFRRIDMISHLQEILGEEFPKDFNSDAAIPKLREICATHKISCPPPYTNAKVLDRMVGHFIEPLCVQPTFIFNHPTSLSPLAKEHETREGITERFELFINRQEFCNAYSELNDPREQRRRFQRQQEDKLKGDVEAQPMDEKFCIALEHGLPPTAGWGMGIDRLCMLLTNKTSIREVIAFPVQKMHQADKPEKE